MKCTPSATARKVPFPMLASKTGSTTSSRASLGLQRGGGSAPSPVERVGGVKVAGKPAASVVSLVQGLGIGLFFFFFFLVAHPFRCGAVCPCAAEQGVLLQCHNQVSCEQRPRSCSPTKHSCSQVCQQVLVCRKQQRWY